MALHHVGLLEIHCIDGSKASKSAKGIGQKKSAQKRSASAIEGDNSGTSADTKSAASKKSKSSVAAPDEMVDVIDMKALTALRQKSCKDVAGNKVKGVDKKKSAKLVAISSSNYDAVEVIDLKTLAALRNK
jgi:hypothetical protein